MDKIGPERPCDELLTPVYRWHVTEVVLATNPDVEGVTTATYLSRTINLLGMILSYLIGKRTSVAETLSTQMSNIGTQLRHVGRFSMANHMRTSSSGEKTPEASSVDMKNISTLRAGQGAQILRAHDRPDNTPEPQIENRSSAVAAIVALTALFLLFRCATLIKSESRQQPAESSQLPCRREAAG